MYIYIYTHTYILYVCIGIFLNQGVLGGLGIDRSKPRRVAAGKGMIDAGIPHGLWVPGLGAVSSQLHGDYRMLLLRCWFSLR